MKVTGLLPRQNPFQHFCRVFFCPVGIYMQPYKKEEKYPLTRVDGIAAVHSCTQKTGDIRKGQKAWGGRENYHAQHSYKKTGIEEKGRTKPIGLHVCI